MFKNLMTTKAGWGTTVVRVITGIVFIGHGLPKIGIGSERSIQGLADWLGGSLGLPLPMLMAVLVVAAEVVGGFAMVIGLFVRPAALTTFIAMIVATTMVHWDAGMFGDGGYQWSLLLALISLGLMLDGAGKASLDQRFAAA
ncbi:MAG: DoxX family protein [Pseudomonadota bacterium]